MSKTIGENLFELVKEGTTFLVVVNGNAIFTSKSKVEAERYFEQTIRDFGG